MGKRGMAGLEAWGRGMTGTKQCKNRYSVRLGKIISKMTQKIGPEATFLRDFLKHVFKTYQLSLFSIV